MFGRKQFLLFFLLIASLTNSQNIPTKSATSRTFSTNSNANILSKKIINTTSASITIEGAQI
jgi:hypothetical protein